MREWWWQGKVFTDPSKLICDLPRRDGGIVSVPQLNNIYHGDCLEIMRSWPDKCIDLVVTDPPYGMNYRSNHYKGDNPHQAIVGDDKFPLEALTEMFRISRNGVFAFCRWNNLKELPTPKSFIAWVKNNWSAGDLEHEYGRQWEGCGFWPQEGHKFVSRPPDVIDSRRVPPTELYHPTEKPVSVPYQIIAANEGDTILDQFCGSGTTLIAAHKLGRKWVGIEIEKKYVDIAADRIAKETAQGALF